MERIKSKSISRGSRSKVVSITSVHGSYCNVRRIYSLELYKRPVETLKGLRHRYFILARVYGNQNKSRAVSLGEYKDATVAEMVFDKLHSILNDPDYRSSKLDMCVLEYKLEGDE